MMEQHTKTLFKRVVYRHTPRNPNEVHRAELAVAGFNTKLAVGITKGFGSIWAFYILVAWMLLWMALATTGIWLFRHDPYPFTFLLFLSNLVQLWALPVLAVGQSVLGHKQELQSDEAFNTTMKTYHDIEQVMDHLDRQDEAILAILARLEAKGSVKNA